MSQPPTKIFDSETALPDARLDARSKTLLGFETRYARVRDQLRLLLSADQLPAWNTKHHHGRLALCDLISEQYPLAIFHGDVGTGKTATAETIANRLVAETRTEDSVLFKLSNRVRGSGKVGEMGSLISEAFAQVAKAAGRGRRAILVIDEGDSLAAARAQDHSHHEDKVGVNTLIQEIDSIRQFGGRVMVFLCTNRLSALDPALRRRAAIVEEFRRPSAEERRQLFAMDLGALALAEAQISHLVSATGARAGRPDWTYSDIRTRLYPAAMSLAFPDRPLTFDHLRGVVDRMAPSPVIEDR
jgi:SpoVK/Ycf46/Vps4 family AAA+-type ATPase